MSFYKLLVQSEWRTASEFWLCLLISCYIDVECNPEARKDLGGGEDSLSFMKGKTFQKCKRQNTILFCPLEEHLILSQKSYPRDCWRNLSWSFDKSYVFNLACMCVFLHKYGDQRKALWKLVLSCHVVLRQSLSCFCCCAVYWPESFLLIILSASNSEKESWGNNCLPQHQAFSCGLWESDLGS